MTDRDTELDLLKAAMVAATPAADAHRRAESLARAQEVFARQHQAPKHSTPSFWQRLMSPSGALAGLGTGVAAIAAMVLFVQPTGGPMGPPAETALAPQATASATFSDDAAPESRMAAPAMEEALVAPEGLADMSVAEPAPSASAALADPIQLLRDILASGRLPEAGEVDANSLINALAPTLGIRPPIRYAVPWSDGVVLRDSGRRGDPVRFELLPSDGTDIAGEIFEPEGPSEIRTMIAIAGFATLLENGARDLQGWRFADALALARTSGAASPDTLDLMETAAAIAADMP